MTEVWAVYGAVRCRDFCRQVGVRVLVVHNVSNNRTMRIGGDERSLLDPLLQSAWLRQESPVP